DRTAADQVLVHRLAVDHRSRLPDVPRQAHPARHPVQFAQGEREIPLGRVAHADPPLPLPEAIELGPVPGGNRLPVGVLVLPPNRRREAFVVDRVGHRRTGPNTFTTRPSGRFPLSRTSGPREWANSARARTVPSWSLFTTTPRRLMPPLVRARYACLVFNGNAIIFVAVVAKRKASGHEFRLQNDPLAAPRNRGQSLARGSAASLPLAVSVLLPLFPNRLHVAPMGEQARRGNLHPSAFDARAAPMKLVPFEMERWQSTWEHSVKFNLSES